MPDGRNKISALGLILLLAIPLLFSVFLAVQQKLLHFNSQLKFNTEFVQTITLSKENIHWVKKDKELLIDGKYFDVKSIKQDGEKLLFTGYFDHKEDKLVNKIKNLIHRDQESDLVFGNSGFKFAFFPAYDDCVRLQANLIWKSISKPNCGYTVSIPEAPSFVVIEPPEL